MPQSVEILAPAKVNLRLRVLAQEASGYHALESLFCAISLADRLRVSRGGEQIELEVAGASDPGPVHDNLVFRAAQLYLLETGGVDGGVRIHLEKRIPAAAGLGGGSSDAAAALLALNALHDSPASPEALLQMGIELGSDVPFFLCGSTLALGWSRGERLLTLPPLPSRPVLVAHPGVAMPTADAFQRIAELRGGVYEPEAFRMGLGRVTTWDGVESVAANSFEAVADERLPELVRARETMLAAGARIAMLAGSGSAIFGVFPSAAERDAAEALVREIGFATWRAETLHAGPAPQIT